MLEADFRKRLRGGAGPFGNQLDRINWKGDRLDWPLAFLRIAVILSRQCSGCAACSFGRLNDPALLGRSGNGDELARLTTVEGLIHPDT